MYARYPLFHSHIDLAHKHWKSLLKPGDSVIDATCGNGHDTLVLANLVLTPDQGSLFAFDLQPLAIDSCRQMLVSNLPKNIFKKIRFYTCCHSKFPKEIKNESIKLIAYNLGYLPGGDKSLTTKSETSLKSVEEAMALLVEGGVISITCYPGHDAGKEEQDKILQFSSTLDPKKWSCCHHIWMNRKAAPSLLLIQKKIK